MNTVWNGSLSIGLDWHKDLQIAAFLFFFNDLNTIKRAVTWWGHFRQDILELPHLPPHNIKYLTLKTEQSFVNHQKVQFAYASKK